MENVMIEDQKELEKKRTLALKEILKIYDEKAAVKEFGHV